MRDINFEIFKENVNQFVDKKIAEGKEKFIIFPMGEWGKSCRNILRERGIEPALCLDTNNYDNKEIYSIEYLESINLQDVNVIIATAHDLIKQSLLQKAEKLVKKEDIYITSEQIQTLPIKRLIKKEKVNLDFLCVGFSKCGTSSLDSFLRENENIKLPIPKETLFLHNVSDAAHERLHKLYEMNERHIKVGGIEPSYWGMPKSVLEYFGKDLKIIFIVRNPVKALFSEFGMSARLCHYKFVVDLFQKHREVSMDMFRDFADTLKYKYEYSETLKEWMKYYKRDQIKIVFSEEMYSNPSEEMYQLQKFIGLTEEESIPCLEFPHKNVGTTVTRNYEAAVLNHLLHDKYIENYYNPSQRDLVSEIQYEINKYAQVEYNEKLPADIYEELLQYYMPSIKELEEITGRSLEGIWY